MPTLSVLTTGLVGDVVALGALTAMAIGTVELVRHGRWPGRLLLVAGALVWPLPDHPLQGPVVIKLSYLHGIHASDLLSLVAFGLAAGWPAHRSSIPGGRR